MEFRCYDDAGEFYARAEDFLLRHEAEHNLILGLCGRLMKSPGYYEQPSYLATVEAGGAVVAAALMTPPWNLTLSRVDAPAGKALALVARDLHRRYAALPGVLGPADVSRRFAEEWRRASGQRRRGAWHAS